MTHSSKPSRAAHPFRFDGEHPRDLVEALRAALVAFKDHTLRELDSSCRSAPGADERGRVVVDLLEASARFAIQLCESGEPPQNMLIALKSVLRQAHTGALAEDFVEAQTFAVRAAIAAYFDARPISSHRAPGKRAVLIVDDDIDTLTVVADAVNAVGFEVALVGVANDILDSVRGLRPAAVILDVKLPGLNGKAMLASLKAEPSSANVPVIALATTEAARSELIKSGFEKVLVKPVEPSGVLRALAEYTTAE